MRLSEHMEMGVFLLRHKSGGIGTVEEGTGCALVLASMSLCGHDDYPKSIIPRYPWTIRSKRYCPECDINYQVPLSLIVHLNDNHRWPLARIADWVRSIEPPEPDVPETQERGCETSPELTAPREA